MCSTERKSALLVSMVLIGLLIAGCQTVGRAPPNPSPSATTLQTATSAVGEATSPTQITPPPAASTVFPEAQPTTNTPAPEPTSTDTAIPSSPTPTATATWTPTPLPPSPSPSATWTDTPVPPTDTPPASPLPPTATSSPPTPTPSVHRFLPAGSAQADPSHPCPSCPKAPAYIVGHVLDAAGQPLAGVRLVCYNEWYRYPIVASKGGGEYDFLITQADTTWYVVVLDQNDQPISPEAPVTVRLVEACRYVLDWRRVK